MFSPIFQRFSLFLSFPINYVLRCFVLFFCQYITVTFFSLLFTSPAALPLCQRHIVVVVLGQSIYPFVSPSVCQSAYLSVSLYACPQTNVAYKFGCLQGTELSCSMHIVGSCSVLPILCPQPSYCATGSRWREHRFLFLFLKDKFNSLVNSMFLFLSPTSFLFSPVFFVLLLSSSLPLSLQYMKSCLFFSHFSIILSCFLSITISQQFPFLCSPRLRTPSTRNSLDT